MLLQYTDTDVDLMARLMRAEAVGEGDLGMLMVGNVIVNRAIANCLTFKPIRTIRDVVYQNPGGFSGTNSPMFAARSTTKERDLALRNLRGQTYYPATDALWFYAPKTGVNCITYWYEQRNSGRYKNHCFYIPYEGICPEIR